MKLKIVVSVFVFALSGFSVANEHKLVKVKNGYVVSLQNGGLACANAEHLGEYFSRLAEGHEDSRDKAELLIAHRDTTNVDQASCLHVPSEVKFKVVSIYAPKPGNGDAALSDRISIIGLKMLDDSPNVPVLYTLSGTVEKKFR